MNTSRMTLAAIRSPSSSRPSFAALLSGAALGVTVGLLPLERGPACIFIDERTSAFFSRHSYYTSRPSRPEAAEASRASRRQAYELRLTMAFQYVEVDLCDDVAAL